jgi:hypothetical protein
VYQSQVRLNADEDVRNQSNLNPNNKTKMKIMNRHKGFHAAGGSEADRQQQRTLKQRSLRKRKKLHKLEINAKERTERSNLTKGPALMKRKSALKRPKSRKIKQGGNNNHKKMAKVPDAGVVHPLARDRSLSQKQRLQRQDLKRSRNQINQQSDVVEDHRPVLLKIELPAGNAPADDENKMRNKNHADAKEPSQLPSTVSQTPTF